MAPTLGLMDHFSILIIYTLLLSFLVKSFRNFKSKAKYPPSPPALSIICHIHLLKSGLPTSFETLAREYGPLMQIRAGATNFVVASDAKSAQEHLIVILSPNSNLVEQLITHMKTVILLMLLMVRIGGS